MNIYIQIHDKGLHLIPAIQFLLRKYWLDISQKVPISVTFLGYAKPRCKLEDGFRFVSLGEDKGPKIGGDLIDFFTDIDDNYFVYNVYSQVPIRPVSVKLFDYLCHIIENSDRVGRIALTGDMEVNQPYSLIPLADTGLAEHAQHSNARLSAIWSIWSKGYFCKYMQPKWDLWQWETEGSNQAKMDGVQILSCTGEYPITCARVYKRGWPHADSFRSWDKHGAVMHKEDQAFVRRIMRGPTWRVAKETIDDTTSQS